MCCRPSAHLFFLSEHADGHDESSGSIRNVSMRFCHRSLPHRPRVVAVRPSACSEVGMFTRGRHSLIAMASDEGLRCDDDLASSTAVQRLAAGISGNL